MQQGWSVEPAKHAALRVPEGWEGGSEAYRVLLEPRLPAHAIREIILSLDEFGLTLNHAALDVRGNLPASLTVETTLPTLPVQTLYIPGLLWVEPVLPTYARNGQASSLIEHGALSGHPFWDVGLNGAGVVVGVADSGIDADHACFRNATSPSAQHAEANATHPAVGIFGPDHRKIRLLNTSIDGNDTPGHSDYRHGTHVVGSLACHDVYSERAGLQPTNGSSLAHGAFLVVQDIVSQEGWTPPPVDELLWEASAQGAMIHSNSWGDDTTAYTERTGRFDASPGPCRGRRPSSPQETVERVSSSRPTGETSSPSAPRENPLKLSDGVERPTARRTSERTGFSCSRPERAFNRQPPMDSGIPTTTTSAHRQAPAWQHLTPQVEPPSFSNSTKTGG